MDVQNDKSSTVDSVGVDGNEVRESRCDIFELCISFGVIPFPLFDAIPLVPKGALSVFKAIRSAENVVFLFERYIYIYI